MKPIIEIDTVFEGAGVAKDDFAVFLCSRSTSACSAAMAHVLRGGSKFAIYDGAFSEYGKKTKETWL